MRVCLVALPLIGLVCTRSPAPGSLCTSPHARVPRFAGKTTLVECIEEVIRGRAGASAATDHQSAHLPAPHERTILLDEFEIPFGDAGTDSQDDNRDTLVWHDFGRQDE